MCGRSSHGNGRSPGLPGPFLLYRYTKTINHYTKVIQLVAGNRDDEPHLSGADVPAAA